MAGRRAAPGAPGALRGAGALAAPAPGGLMCWNIRDWMCGGYRAEREDGEIVFIYRRPDWGTGLSGLRAYYELRSRGEIVGRITSEGAWRPQVKAEWLAGADRPLNEADLMEIAAAIRF